MLVAQAKEALKSGDNFWAYPLIRELESISSGLAIRWCVRGMKIFLANFSPNSSTLAKELLENIPDDADIDIDFKVKSEEIWCYRNRDSILTAISRLYGAIANKTMGYDKTYHMELASTLMLLITHECFRSEFIDMLLEEYQQIVFSNDNGQQWA